MQVTEIVVSAGRTFNHPHEQYSNLKPVVTLKATLAADDDFKTAVKILQSHAESLVEDHKQLMLKSIEEIAQMSRVEREFADLSAAMRRAQQEMDAIRKRYPNLPLLTAESTNTEEQ